MSAVKGYPQRHILMPFLQCNSSFFCASSGDCLDHMEDDDMKLITFPVKVEDGVVYLDLPPMSELDQVRKRKSLAHQRLTLHS